jgi:hypothetical protein
VAQVLLHLKTHASALHGACDRPYKGLVKPVYDFAFKAAKATLRTVMSLACC